MAITQDVIPVAVPGLRATRWTSDRPYASMKESYVVARVETGRSEWMGGGKIWRSEPGSLQIKQPGDVHRDVAVDGSITFQIVVFPARTVEDITGKLRVHPHLAPGDERGAAFHRLHDAVRAGADRLTLDVAVAEAVAAFASIGNASTAFTRPVRRSVELLRDRLADPITLDDLAAHAGLDKYHLCRAFRAQVGMPPHAYLMRLRVMRAKALLAAGVKPSAVAPRVGLYDQSQLNRHFRRIVGTTPGVYARSV